MFKKVAFTMYPVIDINRARKFYEETLGLKVGHIFEHGDKGAWIEYDLPQGGCLALTNLAQGVKPSSDSGAAAALEVSDLEVLVTELKSKGVKVKVDIFSSPVCYMAIILDSEGNTLMLHQLKPKV